MMTNNGITEIKVADMGIALAQISPFYCDEEERREAGNTPCRSLVDTARAFAAWRDRYPTR